MPILTLIIALGFLTLFSILDIKYRIVSNKLILLFGLIGILLAIWQGTIIILFACTLLTWMIGYGLWKDKYIGGADAKIIGFLPLYFQYKPPMDMMFINVILFLIIFAIVGALYAFVMQYVTKKKQVAFVPVILVAYFLHQFL